MRALSSVVVVGSLVALLSGVAGAADITIRSVPYEQPVAAAPAVVAKPVRVEKVNPATVTGACPCGHSLACVGPKGGRYCVNSRGQKKYM